MREIRCIIIYTMYMESLFKPRKPKRSQQQTDVCTRQTDRQTVRQTDKQTDRQRQTEREHRNRVRERQRERETVLENKASFVSMKIQNLH